jgi:hypothetical protein
VTEAVEDMNDERTQDREGRVIRYLFENSVRFVVII